jgi:hypothetical protein
MKHVIFNLNRAEPLDHEALIQKMITEHESEGYRVIRLDKRIIPDAIALRDNKVIALEADTSKNGHNATVRKYEEDNQYDDAVFESSFWEINYTTNDSNYNGIIKRRPRFSSEHHARVLELRRSGATYKQIQEALIKEFGRPISFPAIYNWITGKSAPRNVTRVNITQE